MALPLSFEDFARARKSAASRARIPGFRTVVDESAAIARPGRALIAIGSDETKRLFDGPFYLSPAPDPDLPAVSLAFVQSRPDPGQEYGNTLIRNPVELGAGANDTHLIYEGLTRVAADAVMAGAGTVRPTGPVLSIWEPRLVDLRRSLGKPRHPTQIVLTATADLDLDLLLMFNVPEIPVIVITNERCRVLLEPSIKERPQVRVVSTGEAVNLRSALETVRRMGIERISAIGGRTAATALVDAGLVQDLYLTTAPRSGGAPGTPWYAGAPKPRRRLVVRKIGPAEEGEVLFEHFVLL